MENTMKGAWMRKLLHTASILAILGKSLSHICLPPVYPEAFILSWFTVTSVSRKTVPTVSKYNS